MVTIKDVAGLAGVSTSTVSRTLSGKVQVDEKTRERVLRCVKELNYYPNALAQGLKEGKTKTIAFVIPNIENVIYPSLAIAVETEARKRGYFVLFCNTQDNQDREEEYVNKLKHRFVDGFLFSTAMADGASRAIGDLREQAYPTVCLMRAMEDGRDSFVSDNEQGAYLGTSFLIRNGFTCIATITGRSQVLLYRHRLRGYLRAMEEHGLTPDESLIWYGVECNTENAYACVQDHLAQGIIPEAVFAQSDPLAFGAMRAALAFGLKIPADISIMGYDNVLHAAQSNPGLTTIEQPLYEMGREATLHLIDIIEGRAAPNSPVRLFPPKIILRDSVRGAAS
jgi:LacI family transcriptional regulator